MPLISSLRNQIIEKISNTSNIPFIMNCVKKLLVPRWIYLIGSMMNLSKMSY